jgi:hypothetical protein
MAPPGNTETNTIIYLITPYIDRRARPQEGEGHYAAATAADLEETGTLVEKAGRRCVTVVADVRDHAALRASGDAGLITFRAGSQDIPEETYDLIVGFDVEIWLRIHSDPLVSNI